MNVLSRILATLVALALTRVGSALGIEFTDADRESVTLWAIAAFTVIYGTFHPIIRTQLVKRWPWLFQDPRLAAEPGPTPQMPVAAPPSFEQWTTGAPPDMSAAVERAVENALRRAGLALAPAPTTRRAPRKFTPREAEGEAHPPPTASPEVRTVGAGLRRAGRRKSDPAIPPAGTAAPDELVVPAEGAS